METVKLAKEWTDEMTRLPAYHKMTAWQAQAIESYVLIWEGRLGGSIQEDDTDTLLDRIEWILPYIHVD